MAHEYKVGDSVLRTSVNLMAVPPGSVGRVTGLHNNTVAVDWGEHGLSSYWGVRLELIEPAPAEPELPAGVARELGHLRQQIAPSGIYDVAQHMAQQARAQQARAQQQQQQMTGQMGPDTSELIEALKADLRTARAQLADAIHAKTNFGDVIGERDSLRRELAEQATRIAWLERELVRVTGKLKGAR